MYNRKHEKKAHNFQKVLVNVWEIEQKPYKKERKCRQSPSQKKPHKMQDNGRNSNEEQRKLDKGLKLIANGTKEVENI